MGEERKSQKFSSFSYLFLKIVFYLINAIIFIGDQVKNFFILLFLISKNLINFLIYVLSSLKKLFFFFKQTAKKSLFSIGKKLPSLSLPSLPFIFLVKFKYFVLGIIFTLFLIFVFSSYYFIKSLPNPRLIGDINYPVSTQIFDRNGKLLYEIYREQNRTPVKLESLPSYVKQATIAIEDKDFYKHKGISFFGGITRAIKDSILTGKLQGGSTITQQLVKSALLTPKRTIRRKIKEVILALWTERIFTKDEILEMYLNQVPYGGSAYGIEEASKIYFGKSAKDLTLEEAAFLAGLPQAPSIYSPYVDPAKAKSRQKEVLKKMYELGFIKKKDFQEALKKEIKIKTPANYIRAPHFVFYVKNYLEEKYGSKLVEEGGLRVVTSLSLEIQQKAEEILKEELEKISHLNVRNGAILVTIPFSGEILAMVGSKDYFSFEDGAFNVTTALRQPGSAIKPIMYALALEKGYTAATLIADTPVVFNIPGSPPYIPVNYDNRFHGLVPLRYALANSYNIPAVKVLADIGVEEFVRFAKKAGITTWNDPKRFGLSLTLGGGEVKMVDMAVAFGTLANGGYRVDLNPILKITDHHKRLIFSLDKIEKTKVISPQVTFIISDILSDNLARQWAFGRGSFLEIPGRKVAVKTGTTNEKKDNWTIGYTPNFVVSVWVGNNDNSPMHPYLTSGITGAAPIWNRVMSYLLFEVDKTQLKISKKDDDFVKPEKIVEKVCYFGRKEYFVLGTENKVNCFKNFFSTTITPAN